MDDSPHNLLDVPDKKSNGFIKMLFTRKEKTPFKCYFCENDLLSVKEYRGIWLKLYKKYPLEGSTLPSWEQMKLSNSGKKIVVDDLIEAQWDERKHRMSAFHDEILPFTLKTPAYYCSKCSVYVCNRCNNQRMFEKTEWDNYPKCPKCDSNMESVELL